MEGKYCITISREFGSHGHTIGMRLAEALSIPFYDKMIIAEAAKKSGYEEKLFEEADEKRNASLLFSIAMNIFPYSSKMENIENASFENKLYTIQRNVICEMAEEGPCVIVGRCSNHFLKNKTNCINLFIYSDMEQRVIEVCKKYLMGEQQARELIQKLDKKRGNYYNYYTGGKWGAKNQYDLLVDSSIMGVEATAEFLVAYVEKRLEREAEKRR